MESPGRDDTERAESCQHQGGHSQDHGRDYAPSIAVRAIAGDARAAQPAPTLELANSVTKIALFTCCRSNTLS
jgi:hypothetical protein